MNHFLHSVQNIIFDIAIFTWYALFALTHFGHFKGTAYYLDALNVAIKLYISLFLIWRFNDFRNVEFTKLDKKIIFNGALYLLMSTVLVKIIIDKLLPNDPDGNGFASKFIDAHN